MSLIEVFYEHPSYRRLKPETIRLVRAVMRGERCPASSISIIYVGDRRMKSLNTKWLGHRYTTDVLSFTLSEHGEPLAGEVYVNIDQAVRQAPIYGATVVDELRRLVVHGALHLAGYDDRTEKLRAAMTRRENLYLR